MAEAKRCQDSSCDLWPVPGLHKQRRQRSEKRKQGTQMRIVIKGAQVVKIV